MPLLPLVGHDNVRDRLRHALDQHALPQSLLLHGPSRVGKQRLALWLAQLLLCDRDGAPCGACPQCRKVLDLNHKDLLWIFPQPRPKDADLTPEESAVALAEAAAGRASALGLYPSPSGMDGIHVHAMRAAVKHAVMAPALARRKVIVVGDAERMVSQEGSDQAANAFLKLLEEPPADTTVVLTSSFPGKLLPTILSRVVAVRVPLVGEAAVRAWYSTAAPALREVQGDRSHVGHRVLKELTFPDSADEAVSIADGAIGRAMDSGSRAASMAMAKRFIEIAKAGDQHRAASLALEQGSAGARGSFTDTLDALAEALLDRVRAALESGDEALARGAAAAVDLVEDAKVRAYGNNNPQLIAYHLLGEMTELMGRVA
jgi:DNA polymerase-3 subunit delta'